MKLNWWKIGAIALIGIGIAILIFGIPGTQEIKSCGDAICYPVADGLMQEPSWCRC